MTNYVKTYLLCDHFNAIALDAISEADARAYMAREFPTWHLASTDDIEGVHEVDDTCVEIMFEGELERKDVKPFGREMSYNDAATFLAYEMHLARESELADQAMLVSLSDATGYSEAELALIEEFEDWSEEPIGD